MIFMKICLSLNWSSPENKYIIIPITIWLYQKKHFATRWIFWKSSRPLTIFFYEIVRERLQIEKMKNY